MIIKAPINQNPGQIEINNRSLSLRAAAEGFVLLKNNGVLPLKEHKIALYGSGARMTVKGGTGSGAVRERYSVSIEEGLKNNGFTILSEKWLDRFDSYYSDTYEAYRLEQEEKVKGMQNFYQILGTVAPFQHPYGIKISESDLCECETAVYVLARQAGEGNDRKNEKGDYLPDDIEIENLHFLSENYKNLILVINVGGLIDLSFMDELDISAAVYYAQGGEEGGNALGELFAGKRNFSGKLTSSWPYHFEDLPSSKNFSSLSDDVREQDYDEGVFVGYRYFDSFEVKPRYCFGYGKSYTDFIIACEKLEVDRNGIKANVKVKNSGAYAGKEIVQVYATLPYQKDSEYKRLVAFAKTGMLEPEENATLQLNFSYRELAIYDEESASYLLKKGDYIIKIGKSCEDNKAVCVLRVNETLVLEKCRNIAPLSRELKDLLRSKATTESIEELPIYSIDPSYIETKIHDYHKLQLNDPLLETMNEEEMISLVVGGGTSAKGLQVEAMGASGTSTAALYEKYGIPNIILSDGPQGLNLTSQVVELQDGTSKAARVPHVLEAYKRYMFGFSGMALRSQMADPSEGIVHYQYATAWPCSQLLAQTFDVELIEEIGTAVAEEMESYGVTVWLAPALNIQRNPLCGRCFEYYSEDPLLSGKIAAALVKGVQSHEGRLVSAKHFAANSCELERNMSSSNMREKTLRELYLRGFEIVVTESRPETVMAAYNKVNGVYCTNNDDLLNKVLRNEWGFTGLVMSDWDSMKASREDPCLPASSDVQKANENGCDLIMPGRTDQHVAIKKGLEEGRISRESLITSCARILALIRKNREIEL